MLRGSSPGLRLLQQLLEVAPGGRVFTSQDALIAAEEVGLSADHILGVVFGTEPPRVDLDG